MIALFVAVLQIGSIDSPSTWSSLQTATHTAERLGGSTNEFIMNHYHRPRHHHHHGRIQMIGWDPLAVGFDWLVVVVVVVIAVPTKTGRDPFCILFARTRNVKHVYLQSAWWLSSFQWYRGMQCNQYLATMSYGHGNDNRCITNKNVTDIIAIEFIISRTLSSVVP